jgi:hypothetical protein
MIFNHKLIMAAAMASLTVGANAATLLFSDNFDEPSANEVAETFNNNLASTQSGTIGTTTYSVLSGAGNAAQHSNGGNNLTLATFVGNIGRVSLDNNFATQANSLDQPLQVSFNIGTVFGYAGDPTRWIHFNVGNSQNLDVNSATTMVGVLFRANGQTETLIGGAGQVTVPNWTANDLVTITLKDSVGTGSAFDGNGSFATVQIGANTIGTFDLGTQTNAYFTFGAFNFETSQFGGGTFDNFSVTAIPEPSAALLGGLGLLALLRRRR